MGYYNDLTLTPETWYEPASPWAGAWETDTLVFAPAAIADAATADGDCPRCRECDPVTCPCRLCHDVRTPTAAAASDPAGDVVRLVRAGAFLAAAQRLFALAATDHITHRTALRHLTDAERRIVARYYAAYAAQDHRITVSVERLLRNWALCCEWNPWEVAA